MAIVLDDVHFLFPAERPPRPPVSIRHEWKMRQLEILCVPVFFLSAKHTLTFPNLCHRELQYPTSDLDTMDEMDDDFDLDIPY